MLNSTPSQAHSSSVHCELCKVKLRVTYVIIVRSLKLGRIVPPHARFVGVVLVVDLLAERV